MKMRRILISMFVATFIVAIAIMAYLVKSTMDTTFEFQLSDTISKGWVWDATIQLQNRVIRSFYQSDRGPVNYKFTHLKPGEAKLQITAPSYISQTIAVNLRRGKNILKEPIDMVGYQIPGLAKWIIFEDRVGNDIIQEIRPVSKEGSAILNHPCLKIWIGACISVQIDDNLPAQEKAKEGVERGKKLYKGILEWKWDPLPETTFRYSSSIPGSKIAENSYPYWVIDYIIVVPDPRKISQKEIEQIMQRAWELPSEQIESFLQSYRNEGKLTPYILTSWNVKGGR